MIKSRRDLIAEKVSALRSLCILADTCEQEEAGKALHEARLVQSQFQLLQAQLAIASTGASPARAAVVRHASPLQTAPAVLHTHLPGSSPHYVRTSAPAGLQTQPSAARALHASFAPLMSLSSSTGATSATPSSTPGRTPSRILASGFSSDLSSRSDSSAPEAPSSAARKVQFARSSETSTLSQPNQSRLDSSVSQQASSRFSLSSSEPGSAAGTREASVSSMDVTGISRQSEG